jgi:hypothetical protein
MEKLIILLVVGIFTVVTNMIKKSREAKERRDASAAPPSATTGAGPRPVQAPKTANWEDELRRLLEGQITGAPTPAPKVQPPTARPVAPPIARPVAPPVARPFVVVQTPRSGAPAPKAAAPPVFSPPLLTPKPGSLPAPIPVPAVTALSSRRLADLSQSRQAYERASQIDRTMAAHISDVPGQPVQLTRVVRSEASAEARQAVSLFKNTGSARLAIIASTILGPPRSLEEFSGGS